MMPPLPDPERDASPWIFYLFSVLLMVVFPAVMFISKCSGDPAPPLPSLQIILAVLVGLALLALYFLLFFAMYRSTMPRLGAAFGLDVVMDARGHTVVRGTGRYAARIALFLVEFVVVVVGSMLPFILFFAVAALTGMGP